MDSAAQVNEHRKPVKKAVCVAVGYAHLDPSMHLTGAHKDPHNLRDLLIKHYGYHSKDIKVLMDHWHDNSPVHPYHEVYPSRENIVNALKDLVHDAQPGDHFVFFFSGHGSQVPNLDGSEASGFDEVIWPADIVYNPDLDTPDDVQNYIIDDLLKELLVDPLPTGARMTAIFDCCHSGTAMDLPQTQVEDEADKLWSPIGPDDGKNPPFPLTTETAEATGTDDSATDNTADATDTKAPLKKGQRLLTNKLPTMARAVPHPSGERFHVVEHTNIGTEDEDLSSPHITSWSACLDDQVGLENPKGGILIESILKVLDEDPRPSHRELLHRIGLELYNQAREAKHYFHEQHKDDILTSCPKPEFGCVGELQRILDSPFTL